MVFTSVNDKRTRFTRRQLYMSTLLKTKQSHQTSNGGIQKINYESKESSKAAIVKH